MLEWPLLVEYDPLPVQISVGLALCKACCLVLLLGACVLVVVVTAHCWDWLMPLLLACAPVLLVLAPTLLVMPLCDAVVTSTACMLPIACNVPSAAAGAQASSSTRCTLVLKCTCGYSW